MIWSSGLDGPSELAQLAPILNCVKKVPVLNLSWDTDCPHWGFSCFLFVPPDKFRDGTLNWVTVASFHILSSSLFAIIQPFDTIMSELLTASLNKLQISGGLLRTRLLTWDSRKSGGFLDQLRDYYLLMLMKLVTPLDNAKSQINYFFNSIFSRLEYNTSFHEFLL
jgi:hypothetical protein